jgi:hypothetical protein
MKINYDSCYIHNFNSGSLANQTVKWLPQDSATRYQENLKSNHLALASNGWIEKEITYKFNSSAFRCEEFTPDPSILFLGCSHTIGIGLPIEHTWSTIVADKLNLKCYNLGQGGGSTDTAYRLGSHWIPKILPKIVVLLLPEMYRLEVVGEQYVEFLTPMSPPSCYSEFYKIWSYCDANSQLNSEKNTLALAHVSKMNGCKFISVESSIFKGPDRARDLVHLGLQSNLNFSNTVLTLINTTP